MSIDRDRSERRFPTHVSRAVSVLFCDRYPNIRACRRVHGRTNGKFCLVRPRHVSNARDFVYRTRVVTTKRKRSPNGSPYTEPTGTPKSDIDVSQQSSQVCSTRLSHVPVATSVRTRVTRSLFARPGTLSAVTLTGRASRY